MNTLAERHASAEARLSAAGGGHAELRLERDSLALGPVRPDVPAESSTTVAGSCW